MKKFFIFFLIIWSLPSKTLLSQIPVSEYANEVFRCQKCIANSFEKEQIKQFQKAKKEGNKFFVSLLLKNPDTVFFLETYDIETGVVYGSAFTASDGFDYTYCNGLFLLQNMPLFDYEKKQIIQSWDTNTLRLLESKQANQIISPQKFFATRLIFKSNQGADCFKFNDFYYNKKL